MKLDRYILVLTLPEIQVDTTVKKKVALDSAVPSIFLYEPASRAVLVALKWKYRILDKRTGVTTNIKNNYKKL